MYGTCALCLQEKDLQLSHIIPKFVVRWLKETSPGGIRGTPEPNRRIQDGIKEYLLCKECEEKLSKWEGLFARRVFGPFQRSAIRRRVGYGEWALKFAVSVSWRLLLYGKRREGLSHFDEQGKLEANRALETWRRFLIEEEPHPGRFEQHMVLLDLIEESTYPDLSPFVNRYILRSIDGDILVSENRAFTYVKMGKVLLFGWIWEAHPRQWRGTKLRVRKGYIMPQAYKLPGDVAHLVLVDRPNKAMALLRELSPRQKAKIDTLLREQREKVSKSKVFQALLRDADMFGRDAFFD